MLTKKEIIDWVNDTADEMSEEVEDHNDWGDRAFEETDSWWTDNIGGGRIDEYPEVPEDIVDIHRLQDAVTILQVAELEDWGIADDSGLWEGLAPYPALMSQAFYTLEQALSQQEPEELFKK